QQVAVDNAYKALMNSGLAAIPGTGNNSNLTATISGTYVGKDQGQYSITLVPTGNNIRFQYGGLESGSGNVDVTPQALGSKGLYIQFSSTSGSAGNTWTVSIPNTQASTYVANYNAYQAALQAKEAAISQAQASVDAAQAALDFKRAKARPADLNAAQAAILTAQGQVQAAQADLENTIIRAPSEGTITKVDVKVGELATALKEAVVLQDVNNLHVEANISEANIASVKVGQKVDATFDALGLDRKFTAKVEAVDPASTVVSGVVNYKVTVQVDKLEEIKPGMTANLTILTGEKPGVLAIPARAVLGKTDGSKVVRVITDEKTKAYKEVPVTTGMEADGGLVEITSGLSAGEGVITFIKQ
ncbi:MAG: efflux RND transporter periplasmic adaptor subunit, partial [Patescibacteria group bacterium]|nr:efflux RND transporter periplasmic adaptor subunit [Patescibacteria group bacterium]